MILLQQECPPTPNTSPHFLWVVNNMCVHTWGGDLRHVHEVYTETITIGYVSSRQVVPGRPRVGLT